MPCTHTQLCKNSSLGQYSARMAGVELGSTGQRKVGTHHVLPARGVKNGMGRVFDRGPAEALARLVRVRHTKLTHDVLVYMENVVLGSGTTGLGRSHKGKLTHLRGRLVNTASPISTSAEMRACRALSVGQRARNEGTFSVTGRAGRATRSRSWSVLRMFGSEPGIENCALAMNFTTAVSFSQGRSSSSCTVAKS